MVSDEFGLAYLIVHRHKPARFGYGIESILDDSVGSVKTGISKANGIEKVVPGGTRSQTNSSAPVSLTCKGYFLTCVSLLETEHLARPRTKQKRCAGLNNKFTPMGRVQQMTINGQTTASPNDQTATTVQSDCIALQAEPDLRV